MKIQTERLELVPFSCEHYKTALRYSTDPENTSMMCFLPCDNGEEVMDYLKKCEKQWQLDAPEYLDAAILLDGVHIGSVSIELLDNGRTGELGWIIDKAYWGKGYAPEAAAAYMEYFRKRFGITNYIAHADAENTASRRVMEKLGMKCRSVHGGRKNRISEEERMECLYEMDMNLNP